MRTPRQPLISVVVAVHNGAAWLDDCLGSVLAQSYPRWELIVVDDGSTDHSVKLAEAFVARDGRVRLVRSTRRLGCAGARNLAMENAVGDFYAQLDADARAPVDWLERLVAPFSDAAVGAAGGPDRAPSDAPPAERCVDDVMHSRLVTAGLRRADTRLSRYLPAGCNLMLRASAVRAVGPFDDTMASGGEEKELMLRLMRAGWRVAHVPGAAVVHRRRAALGAFGRQMFRAGYSRLGIWRRQPWAFEAIHALPGVLVAVAAVGGLHGLVTPDSAGAWCVGSAAFFGTCTVSGAVTAVRVRSWRHWGHASAAAAIAPIGYGTGLWWHLLTWPRLRRRSRPETP